MKDRVDMVALTGLDRIYHDTGPQIRSSSKSPIPNMKTRKLTSASHCLQCSWLTMISLKKREERCLFCCSFSKIEACQSVVSLFRPVFLENSFPTFVVWLFNGCECKGILTRDIWPLPSSQIRDSAFLANLKCCLPHKSTLLTSKQIHIFDFLTNPHCRRSNRSTLLTGKTAWTKGAVYEWWDGNVIEGGGSLFNVYIYIYLCCSNTEAFIIKSVLWRE